MRLNLGLLWALSTLILAVGVWLFSSGFLLTRLELESVSVCHHSVGCSNPRFKKIVLIIIDALRYDFTVSDPTKQGPYLNKLPILRESNGFLARARADPPTTTLQRLKAITTGNLPTFVDAGSNFNSDAINEDNLLLQYINANKTSNYYNSQKYTLWGMIRGWDFSQSHSQKHGRILLSMFGICIR